VHPDPGAHGDTHDVRPCDAKGIEHADRVRDQVHPAVLRRARLVADRLPRVAEVVPDHESRARREALAELILPPVHRSGSPEDQEDRGACRFAEGLDAEADPVGLNDSLRRAEHYPWTALGSIQTTSH
jgi:hypothetical protein